MSVWPDFVVAYRIMLEDTLWTSPLGINSIQGQFQTQWGMYAAASILIANRQDIGYPITAKTSYSLEPVQTDRTS
jgi:ABC-type maltose transport system permease subunit